MLRAKSPWALPLALLVALVSAGGLAERAHAQVPGQLTTGGMDLHLFRPAVDSKGHLSVNGTDILGHLDFSFGLVLDGGFGMLPFQGFVNNAMRQYDDAAFTQRPDYCGVDRPDLLCGRLVDAQLTGTLHFNLGLFNFAVVGVQLPISVGFGNDVTVPGFYNETNATSMRTQGLDNQSLGNLAFHGKFRILRAERNSGFGLAAILQLELPTGNTREFAGDPDFVLWPHVVGEWRPARQVRIGLDVGYRLVVGTGAQFPVGGRTIPCPMGSTQCMFATNATSPLRDPMRMGADFTYDDQLTFGLGGSFRLGDAPIDLVLELYGNYILSGLDGRGSFGADGSLNLEGLLGLKIFVERASYLVLSGGAGIPTGGATAADIRGMVGFIFEPSIGDRDGDGMRDDVDQCPTEPEDFDGFADEDGCPDPDNDRDGI
ncbi:MAG: hypothetical protein IT378_15360, partial [Sandaracinaceae bacterium]|nr:hypothetical protein [Sandaracinaceae bacterium]